MTALLRYDAACRALAEAKSLDEVKDVRDKAEAVRLYARQAKNRDLEVDAAEIRLRAERRLGELIVVQKDGEGLNSGTLRRGSTAEPRDQRPTLVDLGVDKKLSSRAQRLAAVPEARFEAEVATWRDRVGQENERVTTTLLREGDKAARREKNRAAVDAAGTVEDLRGLIDGGYTFATLYIDPPWDYETWSDKGADRSPSQHYDVMTLDELADLPVGELAADDCILHLWTISTLLPAALDLIKAWGFTYKKVGFIWTKTVADGSAAKMGNGKWTRDEAEVCLLATRGAPERLDAGVRQTLAAPLGEHSAKPDEIRARIERLTAGPYLELFGRKEVPGWTVWGNQVRWCAPLPPHDPATGEIIESEAAGQAVVTAGAATSPVIAGDDDRRKATIAGGFDRDPAGVGDGGLTTQVVAPAPAVMPDMPDFLRRDLTGSVH